jgi:hypothetical protein
MEKTVEMLVFILSMTQSNIQFVKIFELTRLQIHLTDKTIKIEYIKLAKVSNAPAPTRDSGKSSSTNYNMKKCDLFIRWLPVCTAFFNH